MDFIMSHLVLILGLLVGISELLGLAGKGGVLAIVSSILKSAYDAVKAKQPPQQ